MGVKLQITKKFKILNPKLKINPNHIPKAFGTKFKKKYKNSNFGQI